MTQLPLPRIILGDHGFMHGYGSTLPDEEIVELMIYAIKRGIGMLSAGDFRLPRLIVDAFKRQDLTSRWMMHSDAELMLGPDRAFPRAMAAMDRALAARIGDAARRDVIMQPFLESFDDVAPLGAEEIERVALDREHLESQCRTIVNYRPEIVTVGGDATDFLLACGRTDLFDLILQRISAAAAAVGTKVFLCTYVGFCFAEPFDRLMKRQDIAGLMVPANIAAHGMLPNSSQARLHLRAIRKPVIAMHALAIGVLPLEPALRGVLEWPEIESVVVGASTPPHIAELARFMTCERIVEGKADVPR